MRSEKRRRVQRNISLQPDHELAIRFLSDESGHETPSRAVQELIEREMFSRFGRNWREELRERVVIVTLHDRELAAAS